MSIPDEQAAEMIRRLNAYEDGRLAAAVAEQAGTIARLQREARRFYHADGSFEELEPGEVVRRRIEAAGEVERLRAERDEARADARRLLEPTVIEACERRADHTPDGRPKYHAQIQGEPGYWSCGESIPAAIGELVRTHPERFGVVILVLPGRLAR